jgi:exodeoxyribonuclease V beta subunit
MQAAFDVLRDVWSAEKKAIQGFFGDDAKWANKPYNDSAQMAEAFAQLGVCLASPNLTPDALEVLSQFCTSEIAKKISKKARLAAPKHRFFDLCEEFARAEKKFVIGVQLQALRHVQSELPRCKGELKIQFYDDLLTNLHRALKGDAGKPLAAALRIQYKAALIDEFQDTDPLQYEIFHDVFAGLENFLFLIGDPKQAIYGFRGADIFTYLDASRHADHVHTLKENWRSESGLVRAVNTVFSAPPQPFVFPGIGFHPAAARGQADQKPLTFDGEMKPPLQIWFHRRSADGKDISVGAAEKELPHIVASEMVALLTSEAKLGGRKILPEDLAVLVPRNHQAQLVQDALKQRGIPSVLHTTASLFESHEMLETQRVLTAIADSSRESALLAALGTDLLGRTSSQLESFVAQEQQGQEILARFRDYLDLWSGRGFIQMFRRFLQHEQVRPRLLAFADGERRLTNLLHAAEVLHHASLERRLGVNGLIQWIDEQRQAKGQVAEEHQLRLETDEKAVKLVTIHKSKGLEYPIVFCPFSWKGADIEHRGEEQVFFHEKANGILVRDLGSENYDTNKQQALAEKLAEQVRLFYVALTRAKHRCYFVWGAFNGAATSAPAWLLHPPTNCPEDVVAALEENSKQRDDDGLLADLTRLAENSDDGKSVPAIEVRDLPATTEEKFTPANGAGAQLECRRFTGGIARDWRISSFTSLTANHGEEMPDHDDAGTSTAEAEPASGIFAFPSGANPGKCLHAIFERLDFAHWNRAETRQIVAAQLAAHDLVGADFTDTVFKMLGNVMESPLDGKIPGLKLSQVTGDRRLQELEFYFPVQKLSAPLLNRFMHRHRPAGDECEGFSFATVQGMLKGFIDLAFEFGGRYYVVDWKSNRLGNRVEDYDHVAMAAEIRRRQYHFQYQLYTVALDRYLRHRLPGYDYTKHFGGVFYIFLRGVDPARPEFGIFRDRPKEKFIRELEQLLTVAPNGKGACHE